MMWVCVQVVWVCFIKDRKKGDEGGGVKKWEIRETTLTRRGVDPSRQRGLVPADALAQGLIAGADGDDGDQRDNKAQVGCDAPLAEDDAQVGRVPCEEHLRGCECGRVEGVVARRLTFMLHMGPLSPWPPWDEWSIMW